MGYPTGKNTHVGKVWVRFYTRERIWVTRWVDFFIGTGMECVRAINPKWGFWWFNDKTNKGTNKFAPSICLKCTGTKGVTAAGEK
jgi:hypothetical protein